MNRRCLLFSCSILFSSIVHAPLWADIEPSLEDILPVYFIADVQGEGTVQVLKEGEAHWRKARIGTRLEEGDRVLVGDDTEAILSLKSETLVHLDEDTEMSVSRLVESPSDGFLSRLKLLTGAILSDVKKNLSQTQSSFEMDAGGVVCGVRGTVFEVSAHGGQVQTSSEEGVVQVSTSLGSEPVKAGDTCSASQGHSPTVYGSSGETKARFQAWKGIRNKLRKRWAEKGEPQSRVSLPLGNPSRDENRLGAYGASAKSPGAGDKKTTSHRIGRR